MSNLKCQISNEKAFTLIELLVVVAIIGILMAIGLVNYRIFIQKAEDTQRMSDLKFIQSALEQYRSDQHYYPPAAGLIKDQYPNGITSPDESKTYLSKVPADPSGNNEYLYTPLKADKTACSEALECVNYCLYASLSSLEQNNLSGCSIQDGYNFAVSRP